MTLITLAEAKLQLGADDDLDDAYIDSLIPVAVGLVEQELQRPIYQSVADVPAGEVNAVVVAALRPTRLAALQMAVKLALSSLYLYRESSLEVALVDNPAFHACLKGFHEVVVG